MTEIAYLDNPKTALGRYLLSVMARRKFFDTSLVFSVISPDFTGHIFMNVVYCSTGIFDVPLAVVVRVKYTGLMLWKFRKNEATATNVQPAIKGGMAISDGQGSQAESGSLLGSAATVENEDVSTAHPEGSYVIPKGYRISGTFVTHRNVIVEGELHGAALVAPSVHVGETGKLSIPTQAGTVTVGGVVESPVSARDYVEVRRGGVVKSDVEAGGLSILPGGLVSGARLSIGPLRFEG